MSAHNILLEIQDDDILGAFEKAELEHPVPRKQVDDRLI